MQILIIGAGKVGTALYNALRSQGYGDVKLIVKNSHKPALKTQEPPVYHLNAALVAESEWIFITVPDNAITQVAQELQKFEVFQKHIVHTSGFRTSAELSALKTAGACTGSWHPIQTFNHKFSDPQIWRGISSNYEGCPENLAFLRELCEKLGCRLEGITVDQKKALHLAATISANFTTGLLAWAESVLSRTGIAHDRAVDFLYPLLVQTVKNFLQKPPAETLTGPAQRGDTDTLRGHLELLPVKEQALYTRMTEWIIENMPTGQPQKVLEFLKTNPFPDQDSNAKNQR